MDFLVVCVVFVRGLCAFFLGGGLLVFECLVVVCLFSLGGRGGPPSVWSLCCFLCFDRGCLKRAMVCKARA